MSGDAEQLLPPFPLDDSTLAAVLHSLGGAITFGPDGERQLVGADYSLDDLLSFLSGAVGRDPDAQILEAGNPLDPGLGGAEIVLDTRPRYSTHDLIEALVHEVLSLRSGVSR